MPENSNRIPYDPALEAAMRRIAARDRGAAPSPEPEMVACGRCGRDVPVGEAGTIITIVELAPGMFSVAPIPACAKCGEVFVAALPVLKQFLDEAYEPMDAPDAPDAPVVKLWTPRG